MLALRSLLNRPQPLFSCLRPVSRHARHRAAVLGSHNSLIGSRGYASNNSNADSRAEVNQQHPAAKRHLYVVLDDSKDGFGIHKLDAVDDEKPDNGAQRLPEPPLLRVAFPTVENRVQFAAVGSSIVAVGSCNNMHYSEEHFAGGVLIYDTKTAAQVFSPQLPKGLLRDLCVYHVAITVGNRLYIFESSGCGSEYYDHYKDKDEDLCPSGLHCLTAHRGGDEEDDEFWNWQPLSPSSPFEKEENILSPSSSWYWSDNEILLMMPFRADRITAHAVHTIPGAAPHEHEIFVSVNATRRSQQSSTFSFGVTRRHEWTHPVGVEGTEGWMRHGDWQLPIVGQAHYDGKLDKWLGLHLKSGTSWWPDGYLCAGNVISAPSEWKVGKEKLCCLDEDAEAGWIHVDAKLVPMASTTDQAQTEYCLMERLQPEKGECLGDGNKCLLRLTTFRVRSGENGEPVAMASRSARTYKVSRYNRFFEAQLFWM